MQPAFPRPSSAFCPHPWTEPVALLKLTVHLSHKSYCTSCWRKRPNIVASGILPDNSRRQKRRNNKSRTRLAARCLSESLCQITTKNCETTSATDSLDDPSSTRKFHPPSLQATSNPKPLRCRPGPCKEAGARNTWLPSDATKCYDQL